MRILLTYNDFTGRPVTTRLNITKCAGTTQLLALIARECQISKACIIAKIRYNNTMLRVVEGWELDKYLLRDGMKVVVERISHTLEESSMISLTDMQGNSEVEEEKSLQGGDDEWGKYLQDQLEQFHQMIVMKDLQTVAVMLKIEPPAKDPLELDQLLAKKTEYLLNGLDESGRGSLHWAIQQGDLDLVEFLLIKSCDPNLTSLDQCTPLQLSIMVKQAPIFDILGNHPKIQINKVTAKGTALQVALSEDLWEYAQKLVDWGADLEISEISQKSLQEISQGRIKLHNAPMRPLVPYIVRGRVMKLGLFYQRKEQLLHVNPFADQFIMRDQEGQSSRFKISDILEANRVSKASWLIKQSYFYFEVKVKNHQKIVFAFVNQSIRERWLQRIGEAYSYLQAQHKQIVRRDEQMIEDLNDRNNKITMQRNTAHQSKGEARKGKMASSGVRTRIQDIQPLGDGKRLLDSGDPELSENNRLFESAVDSQTALKNDAHRMIAKNPVKRATINNADLICEGMRTSLSFIRQWPLVCYQDFKFIRQLGRGSFGKVFLARHQKTQRLYALKVLNKRRLMVKKQIKYAIGQANILKKLSSPFIIKLHYSFQTHQNLYMALDYCPHGDLAELLSEKFRLSEAGCRFYIAQIIVAIEFLHSHKILYRDLKPDNILIGADGYMKLADFGLSKENNFATSFCGSPAYLSPEMLNKKGVSFEADLYGIGCVLYEMMVGEPPYYDENLSKLFDKIRNGKLKFPAFISRPAKSLINSLLIRNTAKRLGVQDIAHIKNHEFFHNFDWASLQACQMPVPTELRSRFSECVVDLQVAEKHGFVDQDYDSSDNMLNRIKGYTFIRQIQ